MDHLVRPRNAGEITDPSGRGESGRRGVRRRRPFHGRYLGQRRRGGPLQGLRLRGVHRGGLGPRRSWSMASTLLEAASVSKADIEEALGGPLPAGKEHALTLVLDALHKAFEDHWNRAAGEMLLDGYGRRRRTGRRRSVVAAMSGGRRLRGHGPAAQGGRLRRRDRHVPAARRGEGEPLVLLARHGALRPRHGAQDGPAALHAEPQGALRQARHAGLRRLLQGGQDPEPVRRVQRPRQVPRRRLPRRRARLPARRHRALRQGRGRPDAGAARGREQGPDLRAVAGPAGSPRAHDLPARRVPQDGGARASPRSGVSPSPTPPRARTSALSRTGTTAGSSARR